MPKVAPDDSARLMADLQRNHPEYEVRYTSSESGAQEATIHEFKYHMGQEVIGVGSGSSKQIAKSNAAKAAWLNVDKRGLFRNS
ncbi:hypothetical protein M408DRAFT_25959 [Serendipita vermifera MAFF 305830]|uniref:DRBM domain-containing protein n=1 Tax=Serendipita vermifera MAFF 305830 TaxID=933852 RepID=A0A0C3B2A3_SERVB|nr:hypothetical protein M408DRAFT_25959 [Serendipita vermifera MAFF 305830]